MNKIIDRVRKLMAVANDNAAGAEHERDTAMRMAHNLLAKHNLSMADLTEPQENRELLVETYRNQPWIRLVASSVARLYFCNAIYTIRRDKKVTITFVGLQSNVITAKEMSAWVINSIQKESRQRAKEQGEMAAPAYMRAFAKGAASQIGHRCYILRQAAEFDKTPGTALVLASLYDQEQRFNMAHLAGLGWNIKDTNISLRPADAQAVSAGREFGNKLQLNTQLATKPLALK